VPDVKHMHIIPAYSKKGAVHTAATAMKELPDYCADKFAFRGNLALFKIRF
jgi:hypothetical protein